MTADTGPTNRRSYGAILFVLLLIGFSALLVVNSLGLRPGVGLVPLLVGVPTIIGALVILVAELFPGLRHGGVAGAGETALPDDGDRLMPAKEEEEEEFGLATDPASRRRQAAFAAWVLGFVALTALTSVYIAIPIALAGILLAIRLPWLHIVLILAGTLIGFYALFHVFLGVRL